MRFANYGLTIYDQNIRAERRVYNLLVDAAANICRASRNMFTKPARLMESTALLWRVSVHNNILFFKLYSEFKNMAQILYFAIDKLSIMVL